MSSVPRRWGLASLSTLAALTVAVTAEGAGPGEPSVQATTSGNDSELTKKIEIRENPGRFHRVLKLPKERMPSFLDGDQLRVSAELGVTTDCFDPGPRCTGTPYSYDPEIDTKLVLSTNQQKVTLREDRSKCRQQPDDRQHHCIIVFHGITAGARASQLGCQNTGCKLEVFARSFNSQARSSDVLIIGGQQEDGTLSGDKGRINAIRIRGNPEVESFHQKLQDKEVPPDLRRRVIISTPLPRLEEGDVIEGWVNIKAEVGHLPYHALVGSEIVLAEGPNEIHGGRFVKRVASLAGELTETAGTNCTQAQTPCPVFRTGVLTMREDSVSPNGNPVPLYLNLVVRTNNKEDSRPGDKIRFRDNDGMRVRVYERD